MNEAVANKNRPLREECTYLNVRVASHRLNDCVYVTLRRVAGVDLREASEGACVGGMEGYKLILAPEHKEVAKGVAAGL